MTGRKIACLWAILLLLDLQILNNITSVVNMVIPPLHQQVSRIDQLFVSFNWSQKKIYSKNVDEHITHLIDTFVDVPSSKSQR